MWLFGIVTVLVTYSCTQMNTDKSHKHTNALIHESSPYLLQHAHNPVNWMPWGDEALNKAEQENKMLLISIGYAACHWCHVMEHESFEDDEVAALMNAHFVCVKVDREERPDVDDIYMTACQLSSGRGCGWPLNAFAMPDGRPVWAGTYFPKDQWMRILTQFDTLFIKEPQRLEEAADKITKGVQANAVVESNPDPMNFNAGVAVVAGQDLTHAVDPVYGGRRGNPKFPMPNNWELLLRHYYHTSDEAALKASVTTLDNMALGGIYDQLGGGFSRYSVDSLWLAPHFEKMLYDNGQLLSLYAKAYKVTANPLYQTIVDQTIQFANRELRHEEGAYFASLDADSEGEEGKFYVWSYDEIDSLIHDDKAAQLVKAYFQFKTSGNWEHTNILYPVKDLMSFVTEHQTTVEELQRIITEAKQVLMQARDQRIRPGLDDKVLTSWNGLMITGLTDAYQAFGNPEYLRYAVESGSFIKTKMMQSDGQLMRNYKEGKASINAFLDDYATMIHAFKSLYQVTFDIQWLHAAKTLVQYANTYFWNDQNGMYNYTSSLDRKLIAQSAELMDNVIPSSNSMMARALFDLGHLYYQPDWVERSRSMLHKMVPQATRSRQPSFYSNWLQLYSDQVYPIYEVVIIGPEADAKRREMQAQFLPNVIYLGSVKEDQGLDLLKDKFIEGETRIYVCVNKACKMPVTEVDMALRLIE